MATNRGEIYQELRARTIGPNESVHQYILELHSIAEMGGFDAEKIIEYILRGLKDQTSALSVLSGSPNLAELKKRVPRY